MTEPLKVKYTIATLAEAPQPLQVFYAQADDGTFELQIEGLQLDAPHPDTAKLASFRDHNRALLKTTEELKAELATLRAKPDLTETKTALETRLATTEQQLQAAQFKHLVGWEFLKSGGQPAALDFVLEQAKQTYAVKDGKLATSAYSATTPGVALPLAEWIQGLTSTTPFLFLPSRGGGSSGSGTNGSPARIVVDKSDPLAFGRALQAISDGEVDLV